MAITKQDSNLSSLRVAEESTIGKVLGSAIWLPMEPNSYSSFGGKNKTVQRKPITIDRQRRKGTVVDVDTGGGWNQDLTLNNLTRVLQGFFFNNLAEKGTNSPIAGTSIAVSSVVAATRTFTLASAAPNWVTANALCFNSGFTNSVNNGLKVVASKTSTTVVFAVGGSYADETPPATAKILQVGAMFGTGTSAIALVGGVNGLVQLTDSAADFRVLGLQVGEWVFIGGDTAVTQFANNQGWGRISAILQSSLTFDKVTFTPAVETGTAKTIQIFFGSVLRNTTPTETAVRRTYHLERQVGADANGILSEYVTGAVPNELTLNIPTSDKVHVDLSYMGLGYEPRTGLLGLKAGSRPAVLNEDPINTTSDVTRIKLSTVSTTNATIAPLFAFCDNIKLMVKNNAYVDKAIGTLGGFEVGVGGYDVDGTLEAYFADMDSVVAVTANVDVTLDIILMQPYSGFVIDIPLMQLGDGSLKIEPNKAIKLPLSNSASMGANGYTMMMIKFDYLPILAGQ